MTTSTTPAQSLFEQHLARELPVIDAMLRGNNNDGQKFGGAATSAVMDALTAIVDETTGKSDAAAAAKQEDNEVTPEREERAVDDLLCAMQYDALLLGHTYDEKANVFVLRDNGASIVQHDNDEEGPYLARMRAMKSLEHGRIAWLMGVHEGRVAEARKNNADFDRLVAMLCGVNTWTTESAGELRVVYQDARRGGEHFVQLPPGVNEAWLQRAWFAGNTLHALRCRVYTQYATLPSPARAGSVEDVVGALNQAALATMAQSGGGGGGGTKELWHDTATFLETLASEEFAK